MIIHPMYINCLKTLLIVSLLLNINPKLANAPIIQNKIAMFKSITHFFLFMLTPPLYKKLSKFSCIVNV